MGRFLDQPLDLMVGLVEPDGTERVLPFTARGTPLLNPEQFDRVNSITYRGHSERHGLRFEFNVHSVFYPEDDTLCSCPAIYLEMRLNPSGRVRWAWPGTPPEKLKLFIRLQRPDTQITAKASPDGPCQIDLAYRVRLEPKLGFPGVNERPVENPREVEVRERIVSLNNGCVADADGQGLTYELPVTEVGSGTKWRLVWGAFVGDPVLTVGQGKDARPGRFRYVRDTKSLDAVIDAAVANRDDRLALSRRFEKLIDQASLLPAQRHLLNQSFQNYLANAWWCDLDNTASPQAATTGPSTEWFSVWDGTCMFHSPLGVEYNAAMLPLAIWPRLLAMQLNQWPITEKPHKLSGGSYLGHDLGWCLTLGQQGYHHDMPIETAGDYLLLQHAYAHLTGDLSQAQRHKALIERLATYLIWTDRDASGFPSEGTANTIDDAGPAVQFARKQTYLAVKRLAGLRAAADLLARAGGSPLAARCGAVVQSDLAKVDQQAWLGDHYAVCVEQSATGMIDVWSKEPLPYDQIPGWDAYSIYSGNGVVLPLIFGADSLLSPDRLLTDAVAAIRETQGPYGCGHTSNDTENVWVSQNLWRDILARYLGYRGNESAQRYWDLQVMSNTDQQSLGYSDTYIGNLLCFNPRGAVAFGYLFALPRLVVDRLASGGEKLTIDPDRHYAQRWPLLPLADWPAGKIPVCVVNAKGRVAVEGDAGPLTVLGDPTTPSDLIG